MKGKRFVTYVKKDLVLILTMELWLNKKYQEVRDHCHYTGKFRGATHSTCNLRYKTTK